MSNIIIRLLLSYLTEKNWILGVVGVGVVESVVGPIVCPIVVVGGSGVVAVVAQTIRQCVVQESKELEKYC